MAMDTIPRSIAIRIENAGWIPGKRINEGGGGTVFTCFSKRYIDLFDNVINHARIQAQGLGLTNSGLAKEIGDEIICNDTSKTPLIGAVKIPHSVSSKEIDKRLDEEIRAMASFNHPNVVRLLARDPDTSPRWFIMDYYPRGTLDRHINVYRGNPIKALEAFRPIVEAVSLLHRSSPLHIHRDIKPKNIFVSNNGHLVLGDFGIVFTKAEDRTRLTEPGDAPYSRDWIPEWVRHRSVSDFKPTVDVYMLAKVLYFMLANQNVLPSQIDEKEFDLQQRFPDAKGIDLVYDLLTTCIVSKEAQCKPKDASQLLARIDDVLCKLRGNNSSLLFNFICGKSNEGLLLQKDLGTGVQPLTDVQVYLAASGNQFIAKARLWSASEMSAAEIGFSLGGEKSRSVKIVASTTEPGCWSDEILLRTSNTLVPGWHNLTVNGNIVRNSSVLTGFMLYGV